MINETRHCFHAAEALKIHKPEIKRKGLSPESFRNTLAKADEGPRDARYSYIYGRAIHLFTISK